MQTSKTVAIVWFRNNLRIDDNQALTHAINRHNRVIGVYHLPENWLNETPWGFKKMERFRAQFLLQTLTQLQKDLARLNISLWVSVGNWTEALRQMQEKYQISDIYGQSEWTQEEVEETAQIPKPSTHIGITTNSCYILTIFPWKFRTFRKSLRFLEKNARSKVRSGRPLAYLSPCRLKTF